MARDPKAPIPIQKATRGAQRARLAEHANRVAANEINRRTAYADAEDAVEDARKAEATAAKNVRTAEERYQLLIGKAALDFFNATKRIVREESVRRRQAKREHDAATGAFREAEARLAALPKPKGTP